LRPRGLAFGELLGGAGDPAVPVVGEGEVELVVEGVLRVIRHAPWVGQDGTRFEGFVEFRITLSLKKR
jgi:hypothetical protein